MIRRILLPLVIYACIVAAQLDTSMLADNHWVQIIDATLNINQGNWVYEDDFKADPNSSLFILGPGHVIHPQDCYYYPYDILQNKWYKNHSPNRPTRQCLSSFVVNEQDSMILQMAGGEMGHQLSQGGFSDDYRSIMMSRRRGSILWAYSMTRNNWAFMDGPTTLSPSQYTILPQYDPVHDVMISIKGNQASLYNYHTNVSRSYAIPVTSPHMYFSSTVDTRRGLLYFLISTGLYKFDPDSGKGVRVADAGPGFPIGALDGNQMGLNLIAYDEANDLILYVYDGVNGTQSLPANSQSWIFKCDSMVWRQMTPIASPPDRGHLAYNKNLNLFMMLGGTNPTGVISRGGNTNTAWVYRYKRTPRRMDVLAPAPVATILNSSTSSEINWVAVSDVSGYNIYRAACTNGFPQNFTKLNSSPVTGNSYVDNTRLVGTMYSYRVAAIRSGTEGLLSRHCYTKPGVITDVAASVEDTTVVKISWMSRSEADIAGYNVYRAKGSGMFSGALQGYYTKLNTSLVTASEYTDNITDVSNNLRDGVCRGYVVTAVNNAGQESGPSPVATTFPNSPEWAYTIPTAGTFRLGWQPPRRTKILGVNLYRKGETLVNTTGIITDTIRNALAWPPNTGTEPYQLADQTYVVRAVNMLGQEGYGTDQISPSVSTYGYGNVPPATRFKYSNFTDATVIEKNRLKNRQTDNVLLEPNPFNPSVTLSFSSQSRQSVMVSIYNLSGRMIQQRTSTVGVGKEYLSFDLAANPSGMYLFRVMVNGQVIEKKAMLIK